MDASINRIFATAGNDLRSGFTRIESYCLDDLKRQKIEKEIRSAGQLRVERNAFLMQDGEIRHFLVNR
ncbi:MAG: DUF933 domain-containing protein [Planctomycetota bacterium]|nr:DUF933 domain-containing protein [Planctomycetota bacterium]